MSDKFSKIRFGDGLSVEDEGGGVITVSGGGGGGGIQFDTSPQEGGYLEVTTEGGNLDLIQTSAAGGGDINISADATNINISGGKGIVMVGYGNDGIILDAQGNGDIVIHASGGTSSIRLRADEWGGHYIILQGLPTTDPGVGGALWNNSGVLNIS